jgi:DNA polymerase III epsilon subunit-like protein
MNTMNDSIRILVLDTETNGLPKNKFAPISQTDAYPAILQLSWATYTISGRALHSDQKKDLTLALHPSIPWDAGAAAIHGITEEASRRGISPMNVFMELRTMLRSVDVIIAHNLAFDKPVIRAAAYAESMRCPDATIAEHLRTLWPTDITEFCTMKETRDIMCIPSPTGYHKFKAPKLAELYAWLYGHTYDISGAAMHNSKNDTHCLARCVEGLLRKGYIAVVDRTLTVNTSRPSSPSPSP